MKSEATSEQIDAADFCADQGIIVLTIILGRATVSSGCINRVAVLDSIAGATGLERGI